MFAKVLLVLTAVFSLVSGCQCGHDDPEDITYEQVAILYSAGVNNLAKYLDEDIDCIKEGYLPKQNEKKVFLIVSHLPVIQKTKKVINGKETIERTVISGKETYPKLWRLYRNGKNEIVADTIKTYPSAHLADPATMKTVLQDIQRLFKSDHYGMVLSSHASGWLPSGYYEHPEYFEPHYSAGRKAVPSVFVFPDGSFYHEERELLPGEPLTKSVTMHKPESVATELELLDFKDAIPMHLDYLLFDACLMGCIEVAYELKDVCDQIGFSQTEILADGFNYKNLVGLLLERPQPDIRAVVDDYFQQYADKADKSDRAATISLIDCTKLEPVAEICRTLFLKYATGLEELDPYVVQRYYRYQKHWFYDLEDVLVHAGMDDAEHNSLKSALNGCVLYKAATEEFLKGYGGFTIRTYCGFSMYLPSMGSSFLDSHYKDLAWNKATGLVD